MQILSHIIEFFRRSKHGIIGCEIFVTQFRKKLFLNHTTFVEPVFFLGKLFYSYIHILTLLLNYIQMKMTCLSRPPPNMNSIGEVCNSLGLDSLTTFVGNHWATGGLRVNSTSVKGGIISRHEKCHER